MKEMKSETINSNGLNSPEEKLAPTGKTYTLERIIVSIKNLMYKPKSFLKKEQ
jgi:hypothetical protein